MTTRITLQPAFVLHTRVFKETSMLVELFTLDYGRVSAIARGVRCSKSKLRGLLQQFVPLLISWSGKNALMNINTVDLRESSYNLTGTTLTCGLYLNELLLKLLRSHDPHPEIFTGYQHALTELQNPNINIEITLRLFEKLLLQKIGFGFSLTKTYNGQKISIDKFYQYKAKFGLIESTSMVGGDVFGGKSILALHQENLITRHELQDTKRLMRLVFADLLGEKTLKTRELLQ